MSLKKEATSAFIWDFIGNISGHIVQFAISVVLARILNPADYGLLGLVNAALAMSSVFIDTGLSVSLIQRKEVNEFHYNAVFSFNVIAGFTLTLILFSSAELISDFYHETQLIPIIQLMSLTYFIGSFGNVIRARLRKDLKNKILVTSNLSSSILSGVIGITMAATGFGIWSLVVQNLTKITFSNIYLFLRTNYRTRFGINLIALKDLWGFGFKVFISGIMESIFKQLDSFIIAKIAPLAVLGNYYRAQSFNSYIIKYASSSLASIFFPVISKIQDDLVRIKNIIHNTLHFISFITFGMIGYFYLTGEDLIILVFSNKWQTSVDFFRIILLTGYAYPISSILVGIINGLGNSGAFLKLEIAKKILLSLAFIFGFQFGIEGFLYCYALMVLISVLLNYYVVSNQIEISFWRLINFSIPYLFITITIVFLIMHFDQFKDINRIVHFAIISCVYTVLYLAICALIKTHGYKIMKIEIKNLYINIFGKKNKPINKV